MNARDHQDATWSSATRLANRLAEDDVLDAGHIRDMTGIDETHARDLERAFRNLGAASLQLGRLEGEKYAIEGVLTAISNLYRDCVALRARVLAPVCYEEQL
jgi:hypothetical protein